MVTRKVYNQSMPNVCKYPKERAQLVQMSKLDQDIRLTSDFTKGVSLLAMSKLDIANQVQLKKILRTIKEPSVENVGEDGAEAVWIIAQHASNDLEFMLKVLKLMEKTTENNPQNGYYRGIPYLIDRTNVIQGKKQIFGTQFYGGGDKPQPYPIKNIKKIDDLRAHYGLKPFQEYEKEILKNS